MMILFQPVWLFFLKISVGGWFDKQENRRGQGVSASGQPFLSMMAPSVMLF
jgi:hypothetical protein